MQLMNSGRTLFIDNKNQLTTWIDPRTGKPAPVDSKNGAGASQGFFFESPPSPLSLMDVITVGSPVAVDRSVKDEYESSSSSVVTVASPKQGLEPPA